MTWLQTLDDVHEFTEISEEKFLSIGHCDYDCIYWRSSVDKIAGITYGAVLKDRNCIGQEGG